MDQCLDLSMITVLSIEVSVGRDGSLTGLANVRDRTTRASEFVHNRASEMFKGNIFHVKESIRGGGIP